jgi:hypothetical protein
MPDVPAAIPEQGIDPPEPLVGVAPPPRDSNDSALHEENRPPEDTPRKDMPPENTPDEGMPPPRAPEEYAEFTVSEGWAMDEAQTADFKSFAKEQDLTQEQAQKVLEYGGAKIKEMVEAPYKTWRETQEKWQAEVKADLEIGGTKFEQSIKDAALVFEPGESNPFVGSAQEAKALREALNTTGAGNNPAIVKMFVKMGRLLAEPGTLAGKPAAMDRQGDILAKMYPTMNEAGS